MLFKANPSQQHEDNMQPSSTKELKAGAKILLTCSPVLTPNTYLCRPVAKRDADLNKFIITNTRK